MLTGEQAKDIRHVVKSDVEGLAIGMEPLIQGDQLYQMPSGLSALFLASSCSIADMNSPAYFFLS